MTRKEEIFNKVYKLTMDGKACWREDAEGYIMHHWYNFRINLPMSDLGIYRKEFIISKDLMRINNIMSTRGGTFKFQQQLEDLCTVIKEQIDARENKAYHEFMSAD